MTGVYIDHTGQRFGKLVVAARFGSSENRTIIWLCRCDCGNATLTRTNTLRAGLSTSCGKGGCAPWAGTRGSDASVWRGEAVRYVGAHYRIRRALGPAKDHACVDCGGTAKDWSYDGLDPDEKVEQRGPMKGRHYSTNAGNYRPRCRKCHCAHDGWFKR